MSRNASTADARSFSPITLGALILATGLAPLATTIYLPALPTIADELRVSASEIQLTLTAFIIGVAVGQLVIGPLSDRVGRRIPLIAGVGLFAIVSLAMSTVTSLEWLLALRVVQGVATAAGMVLGRAIVADRTRGDATAKLLSLMMAIGVVVPALSPMFGALILGFGSWRTVFIVLASVAGLLVVLIVFAVPETLPRRPGRPGTGTIPTQQQSAQQQSAQQQSAPRSPAPPRPGARRRGFAPFACFCLAIGFQFATMYAYVSAAPFVFQQIHGFSEIGYAVTAGGISLTMGVVAFVMQRRIGAQSPFGVLTPVRISTIGVGVLLVGALLVGAASIFQPPVWMWIAAFAIVVSPIAILSGVNTALAMGVSPLRAGFSSALIGTVQSVIGAVAPPIAGIGGGASTTSMSILMVSSATLTAIMLAIAIRLSRPTGSSDSSRPV